jgi:hypothetical protein
MTSAFCGCKNGMVSAQLCGEGWKSHDNAYLNIFDTFTYVAHCKKPCKTVVKISGKLQIS